MDIADGLKGRAADMASIKLCFLNLEKEIGRSKTLVLIILGNFDMCALSLKQTENSKTSKFKRMLTKTWTLKLWFLEI